MPPLALNQSFADLPGLNIYTLTNQEKARAFMRASALSWKLLRHCDLPVRAQALQYAIKWRDASNVTLATSPWETVPASLKTRAVFSAKINAGELLIATRRAVKNLSKHA